MTSIIERAIHLEITAETTYRETSQATRDPAPDTLTSTS